VVQEALTNARKHAPGTAVTVTLSGNAGDGLSIRVRNAAPVGAAHSRLPESGLGLVGLEERLALAGGRIQHGPDTVGGYALSAWIPWQA
jgi:signal transduction histidine kinase